MRLFYCIMLYHRRKNKMKFLKLVTVVFLVLSLIQNTSGEEYWQQYVRYDMNIELHPDDKQLTGDQVIIYYNQSPDTLHNLYMHLYPNAFKDEQTLRSREGRRWYRQPPKGLNRSWIDITRFRVSQQDHLSDDFKVVDTILHAPLAQPLPPGDSLQIDLSFVHHLRQHMGRAGYRGDHYDMAQWYPKIAVYDETGWDNDPWHYTGEFYGEFGDFEVTITLPFHYIVGATGVVTNGDPGWSDVEYDGEQDFDEWVDRYLTVQRTLEDMDKTRTVTFTAENVHDFAWATSPNFVYEHGNQDDTDIHVLYRYEQGGAWNTKTMNHAKSALEWLENQFGEYPYPQVTVTHGLLGGGMEYPMLIMDGYVDEGLVVHEIGHIYFYGLLANNEMDAAWLDEGFTTFQERRYMIHHYGEEGRSLEEINYMYPGYLAYFPRENDYQDLQNDIIDLQLSGNDEVLAQPSFEYDSDPSYVENVYKKGALMLWMLEYVMGENAFWEGMRDYYHTWQFKHVNEERFRTVMERHAGKDLDWFFDQWLHKTGYVDYALRDIDQNANNDGFATTVQFRREGDFVMPLVIEAQLENGSSEQVEWFGQEASGEVVFQTQSPVEKVIIDPENKILDVNYLNNVSGWNQHEIYIEHPLVQYNPRTSIGVSWYPTTWYNDIDGLKFGVNLERAYDQTRKKVTLSAWFGAKSHSFDYHVGYSDELFSLSPNLRYQVDFIKLEGRQWNEIALEKSWWRAYRLRPKTTLGIQFRNIALFESDYLPYPWNPGINNQASLGFDYEFQGINWVADFRTDVTSSAGWIGSEFDFNKATVSLLFNGEEPGTNLFFRIFGGSVLPGEQLPYQEKYSVSGGDAYTKFHHFYTRSRGSLFGNTSIAENVYIPGGGNVKAFYLSDVPDADHILALNLEFHLHYYSYYDPVKPTLIFFADAARAGFNFQFDDQIDHWATVADFGIGIKLAHSFYHVPFTLRVDVPLWKSEVDFLAENSVEFSPGVIVSFESLFH